MTAVLLGLVAALALAAAAVLQHDAASTSPRESGFGSGARLLRRLVARPRWLVGQLCGAVGLGAFAVALHLGQVVVVQPLLATQLVFSLLLSGLVARHRTGSSGLDGRLWGAAALVVGGLVVFLLTGRPSLDGVGGGVSGGAGGDVGGGSAEDAAGVGGRHDTAWLLGAAAAALAGQLAASVLGHRLPAPRRCLLLALTAACGFGVDSLLIAATGDHLAAGELLSAPLVALVVLAPSSVVTAQRAFQAGAVTTALPAIAAVEPVVAIALAGPVLGEHLAAGPVWRVGQAAGLAMLLVGVLVLARRQPRGQRVSSRSTSAVPKSPGTSITTRVPRGKSSG